MNRTVLSALAVCLCFSFLGIELNAQVNEPLNSLVEKLVQAVHKQEYGTVSDLAGEIAALNDPAAIPMLIGVIDSDNSRKTISRVGRFGLKDLTGVDQAYYPVHHGHWWRKWWAANRQRFPKEARETPIPEYPLTEHGKKFAANPPTPDSIVLEPTADDYLARIRTAIEMEAGGGMRLPSPPKSWQNLATHA